MKLLLVSNMYPSKKHPHYGVFVKNTAQVLRRLPGVRVDTAVLTKHDGKLGKLLGYFGFYAKTVLLGIFGNYTAVYGHFLSHIALPLRIVKTFRPGLRLILNAHGNDVIADRPSDEGWIARSRKLIPLAHRIIVPSAYFRDLLCREFDVPPEKLIIYPSGGVNTQVFYPRQTDGLRQAYGLDPDKRYIGYVSRLEKDKGWDVFLKMAAALRDDPDLGFLVVGSGDEETAFDQLAAQLGLTDRLQRLPLLSQNQIAEVFSTLDVFCFPTCRKSESLGLVGLEAMACGCVVVASDTCGPGSYMQEGLNGFTFSAPDVDTFVRQVQRALALSPEEKDRLQAGMAKTVARYTPEAASHTLTEVFMNLQSHREVT